MKEVRWRIAEIQLASDDRRIPENRNVWLEDMEGTGYISCIFGGRKLEPGEGASRWASRWGKRCLEEVRSWEGEVDETARDLGGL
jgi:hypothetical protein